MVERGGGYQLPVTLAGTCPHLTGWGLGGEAQIAPISLRRGWSAWGILFPKAVS